MATSFHTVTNDGKGALNAGITNVATSIVLKSGQGASFPSSGSFYITIVDEVDRYRIPTVYEIVEIASRSVDTLTVASRGSQGTTARAHNANAEVYQFITAAQFTEIQAIVNTLENKTQKLDSSGNYTGTFSSLTTTGAVDAGSYKVGGTALNTTHLSDWSTTGKTNGYIVKWNSSASKHEYVAIGTALGNYVVSVASGNTGRISVGGTAANPTVDLATVGTAGTYRSVTTDAYGRVTAGTNPDIVLGTQTSGNYVASVASANTGRIVVGGTVGETMAATVDLATCGTAGNFNSVVTDAYGRITTGLLLTKPIILTAQGGTPQATNGCDPALQSETTTNKVNYWSMGFDPTTNEYAWWSNVALPYDCHSAVFTPTIYWTSVAGTGTNVMFEFGGRHWGIDALDQELTVVSGTSGWTSHGNVHATTLSSLNMTIGGVSSASGRLAMFRLGRLATHASDTFTGNAYVLGVRLEYSPRTS